MREIYIYPPRHALVPSEGLHRLARKVAPTRSTDPQHRPHLYGGRISVGCSGPPSSPTGVAELRIDVHNEYPNLIDLDALDGAARGGPPALAPTRLVPTLVMDD